MSVPTISKRSPQQPKTRARQSFHVCLEVDKGQGTDTARVTQFVNATAYIGQPLPYRKPVVLVHTWTQDGVIAYSSAMPTTKGRKELFEKVVDLPYGALMRLTRRANELKTQIPGVGIMAVELEKTQDATMFFRMEKDENDVLDLVAVDKDGNPAEEVTIPLSPSSVRLSFYFRSPVKPDYVLAVSHTGHHGPPGKEESVTRVVARAINAIRALPEFAFLARITKTNIPAMPGRSTSMGTMMKPSFTLETALYSDEASGNEVVATGKLKVSLDMASVHLDETIMIRLEPDAALEPVFDAYRAMVHTGILEALHSQLGEAFLRQFAVDVILGTPTEEQAAEIIATGSALKSLHASPEGYNFSGMEA